MKSGKKGLGQRFQEGICAMNPSSDAPNPFGRFSLLFSTSCFSSAVPAWAAASLCLLGCEQSQEAERSSTASADVGPGLIDGTASTKEFALHS